MTAVDTMVLFDWNGTIVIDDDRARRSLNSSLAAHGVAAVSADDFPSVFKLPMDDMFVALGVPGHAVGAAEAEWNRCMASERAVLRAGAAAALGELHAAGVWLGIVSAAAAESVDYDRRSLDVPEVWQAVHAPVADKVSVLQAHRGERPLAFYVGDTAYDMRSAVAAGYVPIGVSGGYATDETLLGAGAEVLICSLDELVPFAAAAPAR